MGTYGNTRPRKTGVVVVMPKNKKADPKKEKVKKKVTTKKKTLTKK